MKNLKSGSVFFELKHGTRTFKSVNYHSVCIPYNIININEALDMEIDYIADKSKNKNQCEPIAINIYNCFINYTKKVGGAFLDLSVIINQKSGF